MTSVSPSSVFVFRGGLHLRLLRELAGVRVVAVCDVDQSVLDRELQKTGAKIAAYTDVRKLLEDQSIDAITTATPDHWHALVTIWAGQAGKINAPTVARAAQLKRFLCPVSRNHTLNSK